jgi:hypothetical protein
MATLWAWVWLNNAINVKIGIKSFFIIGVYINLFL